MGRVRVAAIAGEEIARLEAASLLVAAVLFRERVRATATVSQLSTMILSDLDRAGFVLIEEAELERLRQSDRSFNEALHTPRSRGGLSET